MMILCSLIEGYFFSRVTSSDTMSVRHPFLYVILCLEESEYDVLVVFCRRHEYILVWKNVKGGLFSKRLALSEVYE